MKNGIDTSGFGKRAQQYIKAGEKLGSSIFNADGTVNKSNLQGVKQDVPKVQAPPSEPRSNIKNGQANSLGGSFDWTA